MKYIVSEQQLQIPDGVTVTIKSRQITVKGPLGTLNKAFKHIPFEMYQGKSKQNKKAIKFRMWLQRKKRNAMVGTARSIIRNMIRGVTVGFKFKMVLAFSHFPIVVNVVDGGNTVQIKNFLGFKMNKVIRCPAGVKCTKKEQEKNHMTVEGIDLEKVSLVCARIQQSTVIQEKDLRAFLDGIYVQEARMQLND